MKKAGVWTIILKGRNGVIKLDRLAGINVILSAQAECIF